jgi:formimidoylglutamate deiminase
VKILAPDLLWRGHSFHSGLGVEVDPVTGRIGEIVALGSLPPGAAVQRLPDRALLPGFVNAHSHSFQRLLRGHAQWRPAGGTADFWSWRAAMYRAALFLSPEQLEDVARFCFIEMLLAGWTSVGEFHYLQRDPEGRSYGDGDELAQRVLAAAESVGIRIRLLQVAYACGGIGQALGHEQRRFATPQLEVYLRSTIELAERTAGRPLVSLGVAPHSIRAVPRAWLRPIHSLAFGFDLPFHIHVAEQPAEVSACIAAYGRRPVEVLADEGVLDGLFTAVHATHVSHHEIALLADGGPSVCACPTTERDLGDGFLPGEELLRAGGSIALGTDSQIRIDPFAEMRLLETHERLRKLRRVVLGTEHAGRISTAPVLIDAGTRAGAAALLLDTGSIEAGMLADLVAIDLEHRVLAGWTQETLAASLVFAGSPDVVSDVWVGGVQRIQDRRHAAEPSSLRAFRAAARVFAEVADSPGGETVTE